MIYWVLFCGFAIFYPLLNMLLTRCASTKKLSVGDPEACAMLLTRTESSVALPRMLCHTHSLACSVWRSSSCVWPVLGRHGGQDFHVIGGQIVLFSSDVNTASRHIVMSQKIVRTSLSVAVAWMSCTKELAGAH